MMKIKALLFDHDGTISDSEKAHFEMWRDVLRKHGVELSHEEYKSEYTGIPTIVNAETIVDNYSLEVEPKVLALAKAEVTSKYLTKHAFPLMAGALESVRYFYEQGLKIGIVTGAGRESVDATLKNHNFEEYISVVVSGDDVHNSKPAPDCYLLAAEKLGLRPSECLAIEDTYNGSQSVIRANMQCIGVSSSIDVRDRFSKTVFECSDLNIATQWITQYFQLQEAS